MATHGGRVMARGTPAQFKLDIAAFVNKAKGNALLVKRKLMLDMFGGIVLMSPVGNPDLWKSPAPKGYVGGRFRANWFASVGSPSSSVSNDVDGSGNIAMGRIRASADSVQLGEIAYFVNNLPYAWPLEAGHSSQAPAGMVGVTVARFRPMVAKAAEEVRGGR